MITYRCAAGRFNYRAAAVMLRNGCEVLVHRGPTDDFWTLPGGRVEMHEPSADALVRELAEELGAAARVERALWIVENFFRYEGEQVHEICFYYLVDPGRVGSFLSEAAEFGAIATAEELIFRWIPLSELRRIRLLPSFLSERVCALPERIEHIVHVDGNDEDVSLPARRANAEP